MTLARNIPPAPGAVLTIANRSGVWNVKIDDRFYGDYARREWAIEAALDKQNEIIRAGGRAQVVSV